MWNPSMETMPRAAIERLQLDRLRGVAARVYERVPLYRERFDEAGVRPDAIRSLHDRLRLPFTLKRDFRDQYPFGLFASPQHDVVRIHASSGTTGKPTVVGYTRADIATWAEVCARCLAAAGARPGDVFQNAYGYGLFTGGLGMHYGGELMGMSVLPVSGGNTDRQIMLLQDFKVRVMACTPSYALTLAEALTAKDIPAGSLSLRVGVLGAEPWTEAMRRQIEAQLMVDAVNIYGLSEIIGPGVSNECVEAKSGSHIFEDHFLPEVVHPETGAPLPPGAVGELVITTLTKEALPVIRYRTGDLTSINPDPCRCGRTHVRMGQVVGRTDDMLIIRGVNVFPSQVEAALLGIAGLSAHYQLVVTRERTLDDLEVAVEVDEEFARGLHGGVNETHPQAAALVEQCGQRLRSALGIATKVTLAAPGSLPRSEGGKLRRVRDERRLG
ncbi:MAG: phenylacetate--CoA ligase family protein [bacterium]